MAVPRSVPRPASGAVQASWLDNQALNGPAHQLHLDEPLLLDCGRALPEYVVNFETYGRSPPLATTPSSSVTR
jgi:homoserine acetyltransferase